jgi:hypothetical protein
VAATTKKPSEIKPLCILAADNTHLYVACEIEECGNWSGKLESGN